MRDDLRLAPKAIEAGWKLEISDGDVYYKRTELHKGGNVPHAPITFIQENIMVWESAWMGIHWNRAEYDASGVKQINKQRFEKLADALGIADEHP